MRPIVERAMIVTPWLLWCMMFVAFGDPICLLVAIAYPWAIILGARIDAAEIAEREAMLDAMEGDGG